MGVLTLVGYLVRCLISVPIIVLGEAFVNLGMRIAPVKRVATGGIYADMDSFTVNGFGESLRRCENLDIAQSAMQHRMNRECERYRSAVEQAEQVQAAKRDEAKPLCP